MQTLSNLAPCSLFIFFSRLWKRNCPNVGPKGCFRLQDENTDVVVDVPAVVVLVQVHLFHTDTFLTHRAKIIFTTTATLTFNNMINAAIISC